MQTGHSFDERLLHWIAEHRVHALTSLTTHLMDAGESVALLLAVSVLGIVVVVLTRAWRPGFAVGISYLASGMIAVVFKNHIQRLRPGIPDAIAHIGGYSMPSTHAAFTIAPVVALLVAVRWTSRRLFVVTATVLGLVVVLIGASMVYLGAHWATDVLAGWALGTVIGAGVGAVFRPRTGQSQPSPASPGRAG
jgi:membrane-associated phospholipid phosphatase